jgi:hypothetical protein
MSRQAACHKPCYSEHNTRVAQPKPSARQANKMNITPTVQRVLWVLFIVFSCVIIVLYCLMWPDKVGPDLY